MCHTTPLSPSRARKFRTGSFVDNLLRCARPRTTITMVLHRLARIIEYATPRYDVTLYLDDDMYACPSVTPLLGAALLDLAATADVRLVERWLSQGQIDPGTEESRAVAQ